MNAMSKFDLTTFDSGWNGWSFKCWMPKGRIATADLGKSAGFGDTVGVRFQSDGLGDDGIFFLEKIFPATQASSVLVSWVFAEFDPEKVINQWPRAVYVGPVCDLARGDRQDNFTRLERSDGLIHLGDRRWNVQYHVASFKPLDQLQISVGWKINYETERTSYLDNLIVTPNQYL